MWMLHWWVSNKGFWRGSRLHFNVIHCYWSSEKNKQVPGDSIKMSGFRLLDSSKISCRSNPTLVTNFEPIRSTTNNLTDSTKHSGLKTLTIIRRWKLVREEASQPRWGAWWSFPVKRCKPEIEFHTVQRFFVQFASQKKYHCKYYTQFLRVTVSHIERFSFECRKLFAFTLVLHFYV